MGLTENGYIRPTYDDILQSKINKAKELFGEDIDTSEQTPLGKFIRINAYDQAEAEEVLEMVYYARFPNTASGVSLDRLCPFAGITRNPATAASYTVKVTGEAGYVVPVGFMVGTDAGIEFYNVSDTEIGSNGACVITVECSQSGTIGNVNASAIVRVPQPVVEVATVEGQDRTVAGKETESDYELRKRFAQAIQGMGSCNEDALRASLMRVPTVTSANVIVNDGDTTDSDGRPPKSFECYVNGGESYEQKIAETIFAKKPLGIKTYGDVSKTVTDEGGYEHTICFSHTEKINITVSIKIKKDNTFEADGTEQIQLKINDYINGLGVGVDVIQSAIYGHIYNVTGVREVTELKLSTNNGATYSTNNIAVADWQIANVSNVLVEVSEYGDI